MALNGRNDRLGEDHPGRTHRAVAVRHRAVASPFRHRLQVGTRAEGPASTGQDRNGQARIRVKCPERVGKRSGGRSINGIADVGAVDDDNEDRAVALGPDRHAGNTLRHAVTATLANRPARA